MQNKKKNYSIGLIMAAIGVIILGADKIIASANTNTNFFESFSVVTIIALVILLISGIWLFWVSFQ